MLIFEPPPHVEIALAGRRAPGEARRLIAQMIDAEAEPSDAVRCVLLMVSELVSNAINAAAACSLSGWFARPDRAVRVEVSDASAQLPRMLDEDPLRVGGHGLRIVDNLSERWGVIEHAWGKTVWFEARLTSTDGTG